MVKKPLKPVRFYLNILLIFSLALLPGIICISATLLAAAVTLPLKYPFVPGQTPALFGAEYTDIRFPSATGSDLAAWYVPPSNGAVIILVHSYYANRTQTLPVAEMLYKHGYGLLMYDQRASGQSAGNLRSLGVHDIPDLRQAANWVAIRQPATAIGAYGCSIGGTIALVGAVNVPAIQAVASDAPNPLRWFHDLPDFSLRDPYSRPTMALYYALITLRIGGEPPTTTLQAVRDYGNRPLLLISTGQGAEFAGANAYFETASGPKTHWNIPTSSHCAAPLTHTLEYEQHLVDFFDAALIKSK